MPPVRNKHYWDRRLNRSRLWNKVNEYRFKPDGITDNRKEWEVKDFVYHNYKNGIMDILSQLMQEQRIADSHDISKSDFGF